jgi:tetratricopeptide (TPR) repeat protein
MKARTKRQKAETQRTEILKETGLQSFFPYIFIVAIALIVYASTLRYGFSGFDDELLVKDNYSFLGNISNAGRVLGTDVFLGTAGKESALFYRPVQVYSYMFDVLAGGPRPMSHHATNVALHCIAACLVVVALSMLRIRRALAVLAGSLFAVHPMFVPTVAWIPSRGDMLITVFGLASFIFFQRYLQTKRTAPLLLHGLSFILALFSKETAALFPLLFAAYAFLFFGKKGLSKNIVFPAVIWVIVLSLWYYLRSKANIATVGSDIEGVSAFFHSLPAILEYFSKLILPLSIPPVPRFTPLSIAIGVAVVLLISVSFMKTKNFRNRDFLFGMLWFGLTLAPVLWYRHELGSYAYDYFFHRFYLPVFGIFLALGSMLSHTRVTEKTIITVGALCLLAGGALSMTAVPHYSNRDTYYAYAIELNPENALLYSNRGNIRYLAGDFRNAISDFDNALRLVPAYSSALNNRGISRSLTGDLHGAMEDFDAAIRVKPNYASALLNRAITYKKMGRYDAAAKDFLSASTLADNPVKALLSLAILYRERAMYDEALRVIEKAVAAQPESAGTYLERGICKYSMGNINGAISDMDRVIAIDPTSAAAHDNKGALLSELKKYDLALLEINAAIRLDPSFAVAYKNRGLIKTKTHDPDGACADFHEAVRLGDASAQQLMRENCK